MMASLLSRFSSAIRLLEESVAIALWRRFPPPDAYCLAIQSDYNHLNENKRPSFSLKDLIGDGLLWAVPKSRRTIEKRWKRKYGNPEYNMKILSPKTTIRSCPQCGDDHEVGLLCPTCYKKVIDETKLMQEKIQETLQLNPVENEVVVLYENEKDGKPDEFWNGKRIVEMDKPRPAWFSRNLTEQTTKQPASTKDVKPGKQLA